PVSHIEKTDFTGSHCLKVPNCCEKPSPVHRVCYRHQCVTTAILFTKTAGISSFSIAFYSHLKTKKWIGPFLEEELLRLAKNGIDKVAVIAPSFVVDCLETIYELGINAKNLFMNAGGKYFYVAPSLNSHEKWVKSLSKWICEFL
ncbi:MAG: ferrochelatase, partial [candidate division WOR-3 bacterium]